MNSESTYAVPGPEEFRRACARYATGVTVATVEGLDGTPEGLTVNSFTSVSLEPPLVLVCIEKTATAHVHFMAARGFAVNVLTEDQIDLSRHFATFTGDRFELRGFGIFTVRPRKTGIGRNPRTGAEVAIPPGKAVRFKPGKELQALD